MAADDERGYPPSGCRTDEPDPAVAPVVEAAAELSHVAALRQAFNDALNPPESTPNLGMAHIGANLQVQRLFRVIRDPGMAEHLAVLNPRLEMKP